MGGLRGPAPCFRRFRRIWPLVAFPCLIRSVSGNVFGPLLRLLHGSTGGRWVTFVLQLNFYCEGLHNRATYFLSYPRSLIWIPFHCQRRNRTTRCRRLCQLLSRPCRARQSIAVDGFRTICWADDVCELHRRRGMAPPRAETVALTLVGLSVDVLAAEFVCPFIGRRTVTAQFQWPIQTC